ncbi:MAG: DNA methyltransferase, partial [Bacteroidota bacterium]
LLAYGQLTNTAPHPSTIVRTEAEYWTSRQRQASSLHEISYRACFKPQLPRYFIEKCTSPGDLVYDPFMGRGTTIIEAAMLGRRVVGNDVNPLCKILTEPRLRIPTADAVGERLAEIRFSPDALPELDLSMFYHPETLAEIVSLKRYLARRQASGSEDHVDNWIRMVATNRLTGHSSGFFSVYTLPPNQATSPESQKKINKLRKQKPVYRDVKALILKKSRSLLRNLTEEQRAAVNDIGRSALLLSQTSNHTPQLEANSVQLTVTSPPFLDVVQYSKDNWLRCWFNGIDDKQVAREMTMARTIEGWSNEMAKVFAELFRVTRRGGYVAFEVGEVRKGSINLDEHVVPLGISAGFVCEGILINRQSFTKTANIWGIRNNLSGTNSNRIVVFKKN